MRRALLFVVAAFVGVALAGGVNAQTGPQGPTHGSTVPGTRLENDGVFDFERDAAESVPAGWFGGPAGTVVVDDKIAHSGQRSVRIERKEGSPGASSSLTKMLPIEFFGGTIEWRGFLRTENVSDFAGLWMREDKDGTMVEFDNMAKRQLKGTTDWTEFSITLPVHPGAQQLFVGVLVAGTGKAWVDDLQLLVDGKPFWQAPRLEIPKTVMETDHQFDGGSGIALSNLTPVQIENLTTLGKVWGFLKYYHPQVTSGKLQWDYELFRILPAILEAPDPLSARAILLHWINHLGSVVPCTHCATLDLNGLQLRPSLDWISDEVLVGKDLSASLLSTERNRLTDKQFYVSLKPNIGNPSFDHELSYAGVKFPDAGFQILALYRFWNIVEYWVPNRDVVGEDWDGVLRDFLPRIALAKTSEGYQRELMALIAQVHDTHANLWSSLWVRPPMGNCRLSLNLRFIGESAVVASFASADAATSAGFQVGDIVTDLDGQAVDKLVESWSPYYAESNQAARLRDIGRSMTNGPCGPVAVGIRRGTDTLSVNAQRFPMKRMRDVAYTHDLPGDTFRMLSDQVAYLKLSSVKAADIDDYLQRASKTKGLIVDIRNYPSEFVVFALGSHLVEQPAEFAKFTNGDLSTPGAFHWTPPETITPKAPHYEGKIVILVDEVTLSQAEYTTMALRASPHAVVVGSMTSGADGNVSPIPLPGGLSSAVSGIGVFYPDGRPTQQIGIVPDKTVVPTIDGIRAGRDEVLEEAVRQILGPDTLSDVIKRIAKP